jgi:hypothetical protein
LHPVPKAVKACSLSVKKADKKGVTPCISALRPVIIEDRHMMIYDDNEVTYLLKRKKEVYCSLAQITFNKSNITYKLQGKKIAPFVNPNCKQKIQHHLLPARWKESTSHQPRSHTPNSTSLTSYSLKKKSTIWLPRSHTTNLTSLTFCKVKIDYHLPAQIIHNKSNITYFLQDEKRAPFISLDCPQQIQHHLHSAR